ncbi:hypothetical protein OAM67_00385 [bacterium]|nr:hypothetical protein [bacterium]
MSHVLKTPNAFEEAQDDTSASPASHASHNSQASHMTRNLLADGMGAYEIYTLKIGVFSEAEKQAISVRNITDVTIYDSGVPRDNAVMSLFLGSTSPTHFCKTCGNRGGKYGACPGHFGHIKFHFPVYHPCWLQTHVVKFLRTVCFFCSEPVVKCDKIKTAKDAKRALIRAFDGRNQLKKCPKCSAPVANYTRVTHNVEISWPAKSVFADDDERKYADSKFTVMRALQIFKSVPEWFIRDVLKLESRFEDMCILQSMLVPPTCIRPSVVIRSARGEEDLTRSLCEIVKLNSVLATKPTPLNHMRLQSAVNIYHDRDMSNNQRLQRAVGPLKPKRSIVGRLGGKRGRLRRTIMGKRVNNCCRCVIGADPTIDVWQARMPKKIAMNMTKRMVINDMNRKDVERRIRIGMKDIGGAHFIEFRSGRRANLRDLNDQALERILSQVKNGDVLHRMLQTGDVVVFNRQPTLSAYSILAVEIIVDKHFGKNTIRFNTILTSPYNADFDGDEMNMHVPQFESADAECKHLMHVRANLLNGASNRSVFGCVQDSMSGTYLLTLPDCMIPVDLFTQIARHQRYARQTMTSVLQNYAKSIGFTLADFQGPERKPVPGRLVLDMLFPPDFFYEYAGVKIYNGQIQSDSRPLRKVHAGVGSNSINMHLTLDFDMDVAICWVSDMARSTYLFLSRYYGHSVTIGDMCLTSEERAELKAKMAKGLEGIEQKDTEMQQLGVVGQVMQIADDCAKQCKAWNTPRNGLTVMIRSGAKGSTVNSRQLLCSVGQQIVGDSRPPLDANGRTLSCYPPHAAEKDPVARGLVLPSYSEGLGVVDYFIHAQAGRKGLIDTAVGTADSGYIQRKFSKTLESVKLLYDLTTRNSQNQIVYVQPLDGCSPIFLEKYVAFQLLEPAADPVEEGFRKIIVDLRKRQTSKSSGKINKMLLIPFNVERYLLRFMHKKRTSGDYRDFETPNLQPHHVYKALELALSKFPTQCLQMQVYHTLHVLLSNLHILTPMLLCEVMNEWVRRVRRCCAQPGTPVGSRAASALSEPCTQNCLDSFHSTGAELKTGIDRLRELVEQSKNAVCFVVVELANPVMARSRSAVETVAKSIMPMKLGQVMSRTADVVDTTSFSGSMTLGLNIDSQEYPHVAVFYVSPQRLHEEDISMLTLLRHIKSQSLEPSTRVKASSMRHPDPYVAVYFEKSMSKQDVVAASQRFESLLVRGYAEMHTCEVRPRMGYETELEPDAPQVFDLHCTCASLSPFYLSDPSLFNLQTLDCNNVVMMAEMYGIEAALQTLFCQVRNVLCEDTHINHHHIYLLCCVICLSGRMLPITRHGMQKSNSADIFQRASFEQPKTVFVQAATHGEQSKNIRNCLSSSTITGSIAGIGTGMVYSYPAAPLHTFDLKSEAVLNKVNQRHVRWSRDSPAGGIGTKDAGNPTASRLRQHKLAQTQHAGKRQTWDCTQPAQTYVTAFYNFAQEYYAKKEDHMQQYLPRHKRQRHNTEVELANVAAPNITENHAEYFESEFVVPTDDL